MNSVPLEQLTLLDLVSFIVDNRGRSCPVVPEGFALIATNAVTDQSRRAAIKDVRYVDQGTYDTWFRAHPKANDILFVCKGTPGKVALVPDPVPYCIAQDMVALRANPARVDPLYLYYREQIEGLHVGTLIPHFKKGDFGKLRIPVHTLPEQRRIASVLGALDDLIETDERLTQNLSQLQRSAFVRLWDGESRVQLAEVATVTMGQSPPGETYNQLGQGTPFYQGTRDFGWRFPTRRVWTTQPTRIADPGDVLVAVRAPVGELNIATEPTALGRGVCGLRADHRQATLFQALQADSALWDMHQGTGTVFASINKAGMSELAIPWVNDDTLEARLTDLDGAILELSMESDSLRRTRDELLLLLMSGKVRMSEDLAVA